MSGPAAFGIPGFVVLLLVSNAQGVHDHHLRYKDSASSSRKLLARRIGGPPPVSLKNAAQKGTLMPVVGLGTGSYRRSGTPGRAKAGESAPEWSAQYWNDEITTSAVAKFIGLGGQRIDASPDYGNLVGVGEGIRRSGVPRESLFITTKVGWPLPMGYYATKSQVSESLASLKTDYIDLVLIHWPMTTTFDPKDPNCQGNGQQCRLSVWKALEEEHHAGRARAVGVSNYEVYHIQELLDRGGLLPSVNQYEFHPFWQQQGLLKLCQQHDIVFNGYSQLGTPDMVPVRMKEAMPPLDTWPHSLLDNEVVQGVAKETGRTAGEVLLRFSYEHGIVLNPRTLSEDHMREMLTSMFEFKLTQKQMSNLKDLGTHRLKICPVPDGPMFSKDVESRSSSNLRKPVAILLAACFSLTLIS